jgi:antitoxin MazE
MELSVISIGNSKGIRLSKTILEKYNIKNTVDVVLEKNYFSIRPSSTPRKNWEKAFKAMHQNGDDNLLINDIFEDENVEEWN